MRFVGHAQRAPVYGMLTVVAVGCCAQFAAAADRAGSSTASPLVQIGPKAVLSASTESNYGLFTCQVVGLNTSATCYDPYQVRRAYDIEPLIDAGFDGRGKTIVIIDAFQSPNIVEQLNTFNSFYGLPSLNGLGDPHDANLGTFKQIAPDGLTPFDQTSPNQIGWAVEISLDVLWAHAIAPRANITLVLAKSNQDTDILSAQKYAVDHRLGDVISQSFGENESCMDPTILAETHKVFEAATLNGVTIFASSGDTGAGQSNCAGTALVKAVSIPASDPLVTGVGGTELHAALYCLTSLGCNPADYPPPGTYEGEVAWNEPNIGASGGGYSVLFNKPLFQFGTVHGPHRGVPDISYNAAVLHGVLTYLDIPGFGAGWYLVGGTSAGSPQWSALLSITDQRAGYDLGFINQAIYLMGQNRWVYSSSFHDITSGNNSFGGVPGFDAEPGWDPVTGLGSPHGLQFVDALIRTATPWDGLIGILEGGPLDGGLKDSHTPMKPH